jgi:ribosomal protein S18 acetylase RimI-like enzyme
MASSQSSRIFFFVSLYSALLLVPSTTLALVVSSFKHHHHNHPYPSSHSSSHKSIHTKQSSSLHLHPLDIDMMFENNTLEYNRSQYSFSLVEYSDLPSISELSMNCFHTPRLKLNTDGMIGLEKFIWNTALQTYDVFDKFDAKNAHYFGFKSRSNKRLYKPGLYLSIDSIILALKDIQLNQVVGLVEVCIEAPDGKLAPAFAINSPWRTVKDNFEPYLCNLCVDSSKRRQGLGILLCNVAEKIVFKYWRKRRMYLHVEDSNIAAQSLYSRMGYTLGPQLPSWERQLNGLENILYYTKDLMSSASGAVNSKELVIDTIAFSGSGQIGSD